MSVIKGGTKTDYYHVGAYDGNGNFVPNESHEIERGTGTINAFRIQETDESTISAFHLPDSKNEFSSGFFLERPGPDTEQAMQKKRIPEGVYKLHANSGSRYQGVPRLYKNDEGIGGQFDMRAILIHVGNTSNDTEGCLLPGSYMRQNFVGDSKNTFNKLSNYIQLKGWNVTLNLFNAFKR